MSLSGLEFPEYLVLRRVGLRAASKSQCALPGCEVEEGSIPWVVGTQQQSKQSRAEPGSLKLPLSSLSEG